VRGVNGKIENKEAVTKALKAANFKSVRGDFKFNNNHYPIQDYYARVIEKNKEGRVTNRTLGMVMKDHGDVYAASCKM
jgi:branched-chain amino acid transport system substrate-binding protein